MAITSLEQAKRIVLERVELFTRNIDQYHRAEYKEAQLRVEFLDPFFEALGWDVANRQGWAEQYKEVVNEDALKTSGATRAPDYSFRIGGARKFFMAQMLELHKHLQVTKKETDRELFLRQIDATDKVIDDLVYELYGLTEEEIKIIEDRG